MDVPKVFEQAIQKCLGILDPVVSAEVVPGQHKNIMLTIKIPLHNKTILGRKNFEAVEREPFAGMVAGMVCESVQAHLKNVLGTLEKGGEGALGKPEETG